MKEYLTDPSTWIGACAGALIAAGFMGAPFLLVPGICLLLAGLFLEGRF